jgi:hypothetical protein
MARFLEPRAMLQVSLAVKQGLGVSLALWIKRR